MRNGLIISFCIALITVACKNSKTDQPNEHVAARVEISPDSLYQLAFQGEEQIVKITAPEHFNFYLPDSSAQTRPQRFEDFNGDGKEDVLVYLGACGTGGCEYAMFLNQYDNYYKLAFMDYLKGPQFKKEKNGFWSITSYEELRAYDPSRLHVAVFKFDLESYYYQLDTSYIYYDTLAY
jgi:hypothetical protein